MFKFLVGDKSTDEELFDAMAGLINKNMAQRSTLRVSRAYIEIGFGVYSLLTTVSVKDKLVAIAPDYGLNPERTHSLLKIEANVEEESATRGGVIARNLAESMNISKKEVIGIILLLRGDLQNARVMDILRKFTNRYNMLKNELELLRALMALITSLDEKEVLSSLKILALPYPFLILLGKKLVHPKNIAIQEFTKAGVAEADEVLRSREDLDVDNKEKYNEWLKALTRAILNSCGGAEEDAHVADE